jgi:hypothetical protein
VRKNIPKPVATFRVYPDWPSRLHYRVRVFRTVAEMLAYVRRGRDPRQIGRFCKGLVRTWTRISFKGRRSWTAPEMGEIVLAKNWLGSELLSHESTHAALGWARRRKLNLQAEGRGRDVSREEERLCYGLGKIMRGLVNGLHRKKLLH